ncbi:MAG: hypothetical protein KatS3mg003_1706 [Candidatus Nitrosocaldaceae archaeon]|nr:MAG: hypothetical protein KatS3mg003_1706 [Candidatus Nitrosocaldaceae archaeon]
MKYWGNGYIVGWLIGLVVIGSYTNLIDMLEFSVYLISASAILIIRLAKF